MQAIQMLLIQYRKPRKDQPLRVDELPDKVDLLHRLHGLFKHLRPGSFKEGKRRWYVEVTDVEPAGRALLVTFEVGYAGMPGRVVDYETGDEESRHDETKAPVHDVHVLFVVPENATAALMVADIVGRHSVQARVVKEIRERWMSHYDKNVLDVIAVREPDSWLEDAEMELATAYVFGHDADGPGASTSVKIGTVEHSIKPSSGARHLPKPVRDALLNGTISRSELFGLSAGSEPERLKVRVSKDGRPKTYIVDQSAHMTPTVRQVIAEDGEPTMGGQAFIGACLAEAKDLEGLASVGTQWDTVDTKTPWTKKALSVKWE